MIDHNSLRKWAFIGIILYGFSHGAFGQTCSVTNPCAQVTITNSTMSASQPGSAILFSCMGPATSCSSSALATVLAGQTATLFCPPIPSVWHCTTFPQAASTANYNDPEPYGALMNYAAQNAYTAGGGASAVSGITIFQVPQAPQNPPAVPGNPAVTLVTTGNTGPQ